MERLFRFSVGRLALSAASTLVLPVSVLAQSITLTSPLSPLEIAEGDDFFTDVLNDPIDFDKRRDFLWEESFDESSISVTGDWTGAYNGENSRAGYVFPFFQGLPGALNLGRTGANFQVDTSKYDLVTYRDTVSVRDSDLTDGNNKRAKRALYWTNEVAFPVAGTEDFVVANDAFRAPVGLFLPFTDATALMPIFPLADFAAWTAADVYGLRIDSATQARYRLPAAAGAYVLGVVESLPASQAGLRPGSVIVAFDNRPVRSPEELNQLVTGSSPGRLVSLEYVLPGGDTRRAEIELQSLDPALERALIGVPEAGNSQLPAIVRRPIVPGFEAAAPSFAAGNLTSAASSDSLLQEEVRLLREEVLRLRSRLDRLEAGGSGGIRGRGNTLR